MSDDRKQLALDTCVDIYMNYELNDMVKQKSECLEKAWHIGKAEMAFLTELQRKENLANEYS
jgi:hypothetical protein